MILESWVTKRGKLCKWNFGDVGHPEEMAKDILKNVGFKAEGNSRPREDGVELDFWYLLHVDSTGQPSTLVPRTHSSKHQVGSIVVLIPPPHCMPAKNGSSISKSH